MDFRARRQLAVLVIVAFAAVGIGVFAFRVGLPEPSCRDNRQNQGEEGVDCGGPCISCALAKPKDLEVFWTRVVTARTNTYDVAAEVKNPNVKLAAVSFEYEFKILDAAGAAVVRRRGLGFAYPGEVFHLTEVGLISGRSIRAAAIAIRDVRWAVAEVSAPDLVAGSREYTVEEEGGFRASVVRAIVANRSLVQLRNVTASALAFDSAGNLLGVHRTMVDELAAGSSQPVQFRWPTVFPGEVASLIVEVRSPALLPSGP